MLHLPAIIRPVFTFANLVDDLSDANIAVVRR
jgi:hypothetical protein